MGHSKSREERADRQRKEAQNPHGKVKSFKKLAKEK